MQVSILRPELSLAIVPNGLIELVDPTTGFRMVGNFNGSALPWPDGTTIQPHCTHVAQAQAELVPIRTALEFETRFARLTGKATPIEGKKDIPVVGSSNDWHDDSKSSHTTGGARRHFVSVGFERALRGIGDGLASIQSWAKDQRNRPVAWWPFDFVYSGYYGKLAQGWQYDETMLNGVKNPNGWGILDPAHIETSILFGGAALGDLECFGHLAMGLGPWLCSTFAGGGPKASKVQKGWRGSDQERAVGRVIKALGDLALLGIGIGPACAEYRDTFLAGLDPKQHLVALLKDLMARTPPWGSGKADDRTMVDFHDATGEIKASYGWQNGIMLHDVARVALHSGLISGSLRAQVEAWLVQRAAQTVDRSVGPGGVSYAFSANTNFTQAECDKANQLETDKSHVYELDDSGALRDKPRIPDAELLAAGVAMVNGPDDPTVQQLLALLPKPGGTKFTGNMGRYLDPVYGLLERMPVLA